MYFSDGAIAFSTIRVLAVVAVVAVVAYMLNSRAIFVVGTLGAFLGFTLVGVLLADVQPVRHRRMNDAQFVAATHRAADRALEHSLIGAIVACAIYTIVRPMRKQQLRFSMRKLLLAMSFVAVIVAVISSVEL